MEWEQRWTAKTTEEVNPTHIFLISAVADNNQNSECLRSACHCLEQELNFYPLF